MATEISFTVHLDERYAWALALFLKRTQYHDVMHKAEDVDQGLNMLTAITAVQASLALKGVEPR